MAVAAGCVPGMQAAGNISANALAPAVALRKSAGSLASSFEPDVEIILRGGPGSVEIRSGALTRVWQITGELVKGDESVLQSVPDSYLGPTIRVKKGQRVRLHFHNELPEPSIIHWHGLHLPAEMDGHPRTVVGNGETYVYEFEVRNRAGTYWYHPHPHGRTGPQVYAGMAGLFLISDDEEAVAGLPEGIYDIQLVIQDRTLNGENQLVYGPGGMMHQMTGFLGKEIWVNGRPGFSLPVEQRAYRLRLLNGSNARIYKLGWGDGTPLTVIGTDGGLLETPVQRPYVMLAPGERVELWADFGDRSLGSEVVLRSLPYASQGMMGGMMGGNHPAPDFPVFSVRVEREAQENLTLPRQLSIVDRIPVTDATNADDPRQFVLRMGHGTGTLNRRTFEMTDVAGDEIVQLGSTEMWEFVNQSGGMGGMALPHPMHIHGMSFQVLSRQIDPRMQAGWDTVSEGYVDEGWKDTVLVLPGERVRLLIRFEDYTGLFLYHCHNLEHEDMGMMRNYRVDACLARFKHRETR